MAGESIVEQLGHKGVDIGAIVDQVIDKPDEIAELIDDKAAVVGFVKKQLKNTRKQVVK